MVFNKISCVGLALAAFAITGCMGNNSKGQGGGFPSPVIGSGSLADITQSSLPSPTDPSAMSSGDNTMMVAAGINLAAANIAGVWNADLDGMTCKIATPMTKYGQGYRSAPMRCPNAIGGASSWNINGSKLEFFDATGSVVATLSSQNGSLFSGQTSSGSNITLSR